MSERPAAGWFPDPSGRHEQRYWDGESWTKRVRNPTAKPAADGPVTDPPVGESSPDASPAGPPVEAATATAGETSPGMTRAAIQGSRRTRPRRTRRRWPWVLGAVAIVAVLGVGGYLLFGGGDSSTDRSVTGSPSKTGTTGPSTTSTTGTTGSTTASTVPETLPEETIVTLPDPGAAASAITKAEFDAVALGVSQADLIAKLGKPPQNPQAYVERKVLKQADIEATCLYYTEAGKGFQSGFRFCFPANTLKTKKAF